MSTGEIANSWLNVAILAVAIYVAIVATRVWLIVRSRRDVWDRVSSMLELIKNYFAQAQLEHIEATNELRPAINGAKDAMEAIVPAVAEAKENAEKARVAIEKTVTDALTIKRDGSDVPISDYVQDNTHDFRDGLQRIMTAINRLEAMLMQR